MEIHNAEEVESAVRNIYENIQTTFGGMEGLTLKQQIAIWTGLKLAYMNGKEKK